MDSYRRILVPPGIGDNVWILMKLINWKEQFDFACAENHPQRAAPLFEMFPGVAHSLIYAEGIKYDNVRRAAQQFETFPFAKIADKSFAISANQHLEKGRRIEEFLPDLPTTWQLPFVTSGHDFSEESLPQLHPLIGVYMSAYQGNKNWSGWNENNWFDLIQKLYCEFPDSCFIVIGALYDLDLSSRVIMLLKKNNIPYVDTIGRSLKYVIELLKCLDYFIGFPSGLSIINECLHANGTCMLHPSDGRLDLLKYAWPEQSRINSGQYLAPNFGTTLEAFNLIMDKSGLI